LKRWLRAARAWPPLNRLATGACRALFRAQVPGLLVRALPRTGVVDARLPAGGVLRLWSRADDDVASAVYWRGWAGHEPETAASFYALARAARTTLDIGAHVGYFALLAAHANRAGRVYAFEPLPRVHERLRRNVKLNGLSNVSCVRMAVGENSGHATLYDAPLAHVLSSSASLSRRFAESAFRKRPLLATAVAVTSVDDFVETHGIHGVDLVKVDAETYEPAVVRGMERLLTRDRPALVCEVLSAQAGEAIERVLRPLGYEFFVLTPAGAQRCERVRANSSWRNYLFAPAGPDRLAYVAPAEDEAAEIAPRAK
jgi:FkbM family methyltransferase